MKTTQIDIMPFKSKQTDMDTKIDYSDVRSLENVTKHPSHINLLRKALHANGNKAIHSAVSI